MDRCEYGVFLVLFKLEGKNIQNRDFEGCLTSNCITNMKVVRCTWFLFKILNDSVPSFLNTKLLNVHLVTVVIIKYNKQTLLCLILSRSVSKYSRHGKLFLFNHIFQRILCFPYAGSIFHDRIYCIG